MDVHFPKRKKKKLWTEDSPAMNYRQKKKKKKRKKGTSHVMVCTKIEEDSASYNMSRHATVVSLEG
jgi:hypothetical protein